MSRALKRRCPHCGVAGVFLGWWTMRDHCHRCGHVAMMITSVIVPSVGYPWARTLWMAYDLYVHPLESTEIEEGRIRLSTPPPPSDAAGQS